MEDRGYSEERRGGGDSVEILSVRYASVKENESCGFFAPFPFFSSSRPRNRLFFLHPRSPCHENEEGKEGEIQMEKQAGFT